MDEVPCGNKKVNEVPTGKRENFRWNSKMDAAFIEAMLKEQNDGNRINGSFTTEAYNNMVKDLTEKLNKDFKQGHLVNRMKTLKAKFSLYYDIFRGVSLSGFSWNPNTKLIEAEDEVWEELIKEKPAAIKWKTTPIYHYNEMFELFAKDRATGAFAMTAKEKRNQIHCEQRAQMIDEIDEVLGTNETGVENSTNIDDFHVLSTPKPVGKLPITSKSKGKKRKSDEDDAFTSKVMTSVDKVADAIDRSTKVMESSRPHVYTEGEIYKELELMGMGLPDISPAYLFLTERPEKARALFGCPLQVRMLMLDTMMNDRSR